MLDVHEWIKIWVYKHKKVIPLKKKNLQCAHRSFVCAISPRIHCSLYLLGNQPEVDHVELLILFHRQVVKVP